MRTGVSCGRWLNRASHEGKRGRRFGDHRLNLEGIAWRFRAGCPWRDPPADFGPWKTVWKRHHRWSLDGTYDVMFAQVAQACGFDAEMAGDIEKFLLHRNASSGSSDAAHGRVQDCVVLSHT